MRFRLPVAGLLRYLKPGKETIRKALIAAAFVGATTAAFLWGRQGGLSQVEAQAPAAAPAKILPVAQAAPQGTPTDYGRRVVAYIYKDQPITREDLGEYLIARFGAERVEFLVNRRIVEQECKAKGVYVTDAEVQAQLALDLKSFGGISEKEFVTNILKRFNKTLYEWKEDVIRPKLALSKLCRPLVVVTETDLKQAFEASYGPRVQCRMICFQKGQRRAAEDCWQKVKDSEENFRQFAKQQFIPALAMKGGEIPPIHRHFPDPEIEKEAFSLKPGQISRILTIKDGTEVILKCDKHVPADTGKKFEDERVALHRGLFEVKLNQKIPEVFAELRQKAAPEILLRGPQLRQDELERAVRREIGTEGPRPTPPMGN